MFSSRVLRFEPITAVGFGALVLFKKATLFAVGSRYGWPRLYRRLMEAHRSLPDNPTGHDGHLVREGVQTIFRSPARAHEILTSNTAMLTFLQSLSAPGSAISSAGNSTVAGLFSAISSIASMVTPSSSGAVKAAGKAAKRSGGRWWPFN